MANGGQNHDDRPWWQIADVAGVRARVKDLPFSEIKASAVEIKAALASLSTQIESYSPELAHVRELVRKIGPPAVFEANVLSDALVKQYKIDREDADSLVDDLDWLKKARGAASYFTEKQGIIVAELARRRGQDAEQAIFDIYGKVTRLVSHLSEDRADNALRLAVEIKDRLDSYKERS